MKFLSDCYGALGFENAKELWLWKAMDENPNDRDAPFTLGRILIKKKEYRTAEDILSRCIRVEKPELDYPYYSLDAWTERPFLCLAEAKFYNGDWKGTMTYIQKALTMNPKSEIGLRMKKDIEEIVASGQKPYVLQEIPRERIEIPELM